jgi:hypothetical protein
VGKLDKRLSKNATDKVGDHPLISSVGEDV